jgi:propionyl-CoA carboxylase alpha chain
VGGVPPVTTIRTVLVANRAEIASRVFRTCRRLGHGTVAVFSDADAELPFVREADAAVRLPGETPAETYLRIDLVLAAARQAGADAVHPGYGFLSENADLARAVIDAGLTWIGPDPDSIERMGSKIEAKKIMAAAGVPILEAPASPTEADLPLLVKASAGGGGRGMRVVRALADYESELAAARAEAESAFGDGTVFVEPYVERGRHVEVQVVGDGAGGVLVLGERDCSLQRRHQKVVEECPAPDLPQPTREALHEAARAAAAAIDYRGAGTVEFLYDRASDRFWFLEMNTRLQVEHPVTEEVFGVDLVAMQLAVAEGVGVDALEAAPPRGHAVEVRLYAEDPSSDYQPQSGRLARFEFPEQDGIRVEPGYESGSTVSTFYDAMLAKVVSAAPTREQAIRRLASALRRARIHGLVTNREQLVDALESEEFRSGRVSTALLGEHSFGAPTESSRAQAGLRAIAATLALAEATRRPGIPVAWRNVASQPQRTEFTDGTVVEWHGTRTGYRVEGAAGVEVVSVASDRVVLETGGLRTVYEIGIEDDPRGGRRCDVDDPGGHAALTVRPRFVDPAAQVPKGSLLAPMPGSIVELHVEAGQQVEEGQPLLVVEAMKMRHTVVAPTAGVVTRLDVVPGAQVAAGDTLATVEAEEEA